MRASYSPPSPASSLPKSLRPAVFLDRDGTLNVQVVRNGKPYPPDTEAEFTLFPDAAESCRQLAAAGYVLVVATNHPDVGRGDQSFAVVEAMHAKLQRLIPEIAHIEACSAPGKGDGWRSWLRRVRWGRVSLLLSSRDAGRALFLSARLAHGRLGQRASRSDAGGH